MAQFPGMAFHTNTAPCFTSEEGSTALQYTTTRNHPTTILGEEGDRGHALQCHQLYSLILHITREARINAWPL